MMERCVSSTCGTDPQQTLLQSSTAFPPGFCWVSQDQLSFNHPAVVCIILKILQCLILTVPEPYIENIVSICSPKSAD